MTALAWLSVAVAGALLLCAGIGVEVYSRTRRGTAGELISSSRPGALMSLGGILLIACGLLAAISLVALRAAPSVDSAVRRGIAVLAAWTAVSVAIAGTVTYVGTEGVTLGAAHDNAARPAPTQTPHAAPAEVPGENARVTLRGSLTLDGVPLDAQFLGVRVTRGGLAAACQADIPSVAGGRYEIRVLAEAEVHGCGAPGAEILLWTFANGGFLFNGAGTPWPGDGASAIFDASFVSIAPLGAAHAATELNGQASGRDGSPLPGGTVIEAYVGAVLCGVSSVRRNGFIGYILIIAGPDSVAGCRKDATLTFRIDGQPAAETAVNDLGGSSGGHDLDLTLK